MKLQVLHSNGEREPFKQRKIKQTIIEETGIDDELADAIQRRVAVKFNKLKKDGLTEISTGAIRSEVSSQLLKEGEFDAENKTRKLGMSVGEFEELIRVGCKDNANIGYNPEMISKYAYDSISKEYALLTMPKECSNAHKEGFIHIHDLEFYNTRPNCMNYDLRFFAKNGLKVDGKGDMGSVANPAKSLEVLLNHMLQAWMAGATVFSGGQGFVNFNTLLAPFCRNRTYKDIKQALQGFIFNCNMSLICRGGQILFSSIALDLSMPDVLKDKPAIGPEGIAIGVYEDYKQESDLIFKAVCEIINEKDADGAYHRFPNCNSFDTPLILKKDDIVIIKPIGEFVEECIKKESSKYFESYISQKTNDYLALTVNQKTQELEWKKIKCAIKNPNQELYEVTTKKGLKLHVTKEHPFITYSGGKFANMNTGKKLNTFKSSTRLGSINTNIIEYNENKIGTFIGFFLGDGSNDVNIPDRLLFTLYKQDKIDYLNNLLDEIGFVYIRRDYEDHSSFTLISNKQTNPELSQVIIDCYTMKNNKILSKYDNSVYYLGLLAGLINSDGYIQTSKGIDKPSNIVKFSNTNEEILKLYIKICSVYGLVISKSLKQEPQKDTHNKCYDIRFGKSNMTSVLNNIELRDGHKSNIIDCDYIDQNIYTSISIDSIKKIKYDGFTYDLEIEDNHNYFAGEVPVLNHNCLFNIRDGDLDEYSGNAKILHETGAVNPTIYYNNCSKIERSTMGCFSGDTGLWCKIDNVLMFKTFKEIDGILKAEYGSNNVNNIEVLTIDDNKNIIWKKASSFIKNRNQQLYEVELQDNRKFICDENHTMITFKGLNRKNILECISGTNLLDIACKKTNINIDKNINYYLGVLYGFFMGDGTKNVDYKLITVSKDDKKQYLQELFGKLNIKYKITESKRPKYGKDYIEYKFWFDKKINFKLDLEDKNVLAGILSGMLSSDGYVRMSGKYSNSVSSEWVTVNKEYSNIFKWCCFNLGIKFSSRWTKPNKKNNQPFERIYLSCNESSIHLLKQLDLRYEQSKIFDEVNSNMYRQIKHYKNQRVKNITTLKKEDTYCFDVNGRIIIGNDLILTGNCRTSLPMNYNEDYELDCMNTGNFMYNTINLPLIALESKNIDEFYKKLNDICEICYTSLIHRREQVIKAVYDLHMSDFLLQKDKDTGLPLWDIDRTTITLGYCGLNECILELTNENILENPELGEEIISFINKKKDEFFERDGLRWSVIGSPAESTAHRFAMINKEKHPNAIVQGKAGNYYLTNSHHISVDNQSDIVKHAKNAIRFHPLSSGGCILHIWLGEAHSKPSGMWRFNQKLINKGAIFWAYSSVFTFCRECKYTINDNIEKCPICGSKDLRVYDRCFSGDTIIYIKKNDIIKPIELKEFVDNYDITDWQTICYDHDKKSYVWTNIIRGIKNPPEDMIKISFNKGYEVTCTPHHNFYDYKTQNRKRTMYDTIDAMSLNIKDRIINHRNLDILDTNDIYEDYKGTLIGFILGDGNVTLQKDGDNVFIRLKFYKKDKSDYCKFLLDKNNMIYTFSDTSVDHRYNSQIYSYYIGAKNIGNEVYDLFNTHSYKTSIINTVYDDKKLLLGIFAGLINSDGSVLMESRKNSVVTTFNQVDRDILWLFYNISLLLGCNPSISFTERDNYTSVGRIEITNNRTFDLLGKIKLRESLATNYINGKYISDTYNVNGMCSVKSISEAPTQPSYCIEVENKFHNTLFNGVLAENCTGYYLGIDTFNNGKKQEFKERHRHNEFSKY